MSTKIAWKVLGKNHRTIYGTGRWPPLGKWLEVEGPLKVCYSGLHLCRRGDLLHWLGPCIFEVEYTGRRVLSDDKFVVRRARLVKKLRWNERLAREFAADCAERVVKNFLGDPQPLTHAIQIARLYARGLVDCAAGDAAGNAAGNAAGDAAGNAAGDAAGDAARSASECAAWSAAYAAGTWSVAWSAAGNAARCAAWNAAWNDAGDDAGDAARCAAWSAAGNAERQWQTKRLFEYLYGKRTRGDV